MKTSFIFRHTIALCAVSCLVLLQACSLGKTYSEINPEDAERQVRENNGDKELDKPIPAGKSRLVIRSVGAPIAVKFTVCSPDSKCREWNVADSGHSVLLPGIARMASRMRRATANVLPYVPPLVDANQTVTISALGNWYETASRGHCGPLSTTLMPQENHAYIIEFRWADKICSLTAYDATNSNAPVPLTETHENISPDPAPPTP
ncbi:MAG: hypothetical protein LBG78_10595 [Azoarcus sp.]|jgi:hypothetical protein|nr:hypothetical protein [Azoarcus sp.]